MCNKICLWLTQFEKISAKNVNISNQSTLHNPPPSRKSGYHTHNDRVITRSYLWQYFSGWNSFLVHTCRYVNKFKTRKKLNFTRRKLLGAVEYNNNMTDKIDWTNARQNSKLYYFEKPIHVIGVWAPFNTIKI